MAGLRVVQCSGLLVFKSGGGRGGGKKNLEWVQNHYQQGLEQASLGDVEASLLGQDLNVLDFIVEPVEDE